MSDLGDIQVSEVDKRTLAKVTFNKKDLVCGEIVKFADDTFGMFVPWEEKDIINKLEKHLTKEEIDVFSAVPTIFKEGIFVSYKKDKLRAVPVQLYEDDLTAAFARDIIRIYRQRVIKTIIMSSEFFDGFAVFIKKYCDVMDERGEYIARKDTDKYDWPSTN